MIKDSRIYIHFINESDNLIISKELAGAVPRVRDEVRFGGKDNEQIFTVTRVVWVYDEPDNPYQRVNIGVIAV